MYFSKTQLFDNGYKQQDHWNWHLLHYQTRGDSIWFSSIWIKSEAHVGPCQKLFNYQKKIRNKSKLKKKNQSLPFNDICCCNY